MQPPPLLFPSANCSREGGLYSRTTLFLQSAPPPHTTIHIPFALEFGPGESDLLRADGIALDGGY